MSQNAYSRKTVSFLSLLITLGCHQLGAQNYSVYNSFYINPYLYNPAEAASSFSYAFANYRKQWVNVDGAPSVATLNYNTLIDHTRAGFGVKISSYSRGLLNTNEALITYAYGVPFNKNNILYFGISGGAGSNTVDLSKAADPNDPALANYSNGIQPSANFGLKFASASGISLGAALPQLFGRTYPNNLPSQAGFSPLDNMLFTFSFRKKMEGGIKSRTSRGVTRKTKSAARYAPLELFALYRYTSVGTNQAEAVGKFNLSDNVWLALGYRQQYGLIPSMGFTIDQFIFSYSYEPGVQPEKGFSTGSHELQIGLRFGKEKSFKFKAPLLRSTLKVEAIHHDPRYKEKTVDTEEAARSEDKKRYYVYVQAFTDFQKAEDFKKKLIDQKYSGQIFYYPNNKQYYVYTFETTKVSEATQEVKSLKVYTKYKDAKILTVIDK